MSRLQAFLRATAAGGSEMVVSAPFTAYFEPSTALRFRNYAIPDDAAEPDVAAVGRLRSVFRQRERLPRLEWLEEAAPLVAPALAAAGMEQELRAPLMACTPAELLTVTPELDRLTVAPVGDGDLRDSVEVQRAAFGDEPTPPDEPPRDIRKRGGGAVLARVDGDPVAAAAWTPVIDVTSEIVGVATAEAWRRRGLAGAVTAAAARAAFAAGASLCVLSPGDETAQRVYERAGFRRVATMLHWSDPD